MSTESDLRTMLLRIDAGDPQSANELFPLIYTQLRRLAAKHMAAEAPSQTLQATALVHEAYLRVVGENGGEELRFSSRGHFFATAARAMRRILIERARARGAQKRGGQWGKLSLEDFAPTVEDPPAEVLDVCEALEELEQIDQRQGTVANLRIVASFTIEQIAEHCHISRATAERDWSHAKLWLLSRLRSLREDGDGGSEAEERGNATR